jgi:hypothetical protein
MENTTGQTENNTCDNCVSEEGAFFVKEIIGYSVTNNSYFFEMLAFDEYFNDQFISIELTESQINQMSKFVHLQRAKKAFDDACNK